MSLEHSKHAALVRTWKAKPIKNAFGVDWVEGAAYTLKSPEEGYAIRVSFTTYLEHPEAVSVRSTNWAAEYEPNGIFSRADCRAFYKKLVAAGFVSETI